MKILYYKTPSQVLKVKYKKAISELFKSNISPDEEQNNKIKKTIANITLGLMEKSYNRKSVSRIFDNVGHALHQQRTRGGNLVSIAKLKTARLITANGVRNIGKLKR